jgi:hypothetical protein
MYLLGVILAGAIADVKRKGCQSNRYGKEKAAKCVCSPKKGSAGSMEGEPIKAKSGEMMIKKC